MSPNITTLKSEYHYIVSAHAKTTTLIPFNAVIDADVTEVICFLNEQYLGKNAPTKSFIWPAKSGGAM